mmetsp:Transcript_33269/g.87055  ORF Transcript_33269/g.87055 Transcript_33269/m.87055 type:complete len:204 (-) Transcript_33269:3-614(-)
MHRARGHSDAAASVRLRHLHREVAAIRNSVSAHFGGLTPGVCGSLGGRLPKRWHTFRKGSFSTGGRLPRTCAAGTLHKGLIGDTLPEWVRGHREKLDSGQARLVGLSVDVDLYEGTIQALEHLAPWLRPGVLLHFHELHTPWARVPVEDEARALRAFLQRHPSMVVRLLPARGPTGSRGLGETAAAFVVEHPCAGNDTPAGNE